MIERRSSESNPLVPAPGYLPMAVPPGHPRRERIFHLALRDTREKQPGLARALFGAAADDGAGNSFYGDCDWQAWERRLGGVLMGQAIVEAVSISKPTLIFMQVQRPSSITPQLVEEMRAVADPSCVIVNWDGDQHFEPHAAERRWFVELGRACDTSLVVNTAHPELYRNQAVRNPGYLQIGIDQQIYRPDVEPAMNTPSVVMLASCYAGYKAYAARHELVRQMSEWCQTNGTRRGGAAWPDLGFGVYGSGWTGWFARPMLNQDQEAPVYQAADAAISMSIRSDLPRYTSDRLFRALASGAYVCVERFPDMEGLGLVDGVNCATWSTFHELVSKCLGQQMRPPENYRSIRAAGARLARELHTWDARMTELLWIVDHVRATR